MPPSRAPSALIFDMDGVLVDSEPLHKRAKEIAFGQLGIVLPESVYDAYKGRPDEVMFPEVLKTKGAPGKVAEMSRLKRRAFESIERELQAVPDAADFVRWAKPRYRIALATSATARNRAAAMEMLGIGNLFEVIVDHGRPHRPKPDPDIFQIAMRDLGVEANDCWVIEDSVNGVKAGKAAGCFTAAITTTFHSDVLRTAGADLIVASFAQLKTVLAPL